ncbi:MAG: DUF4230 domain-containing protein [Spirochaetota bacterium]
MQRRSTSAPLLALVILASLVGVSGCAPVSRSELVRLEDRIESLLELSTYEHIYRDLVYFGEERSFLFIKTVDRAVLFSVDIRVRAGVDLARGVTVTPDRRDANRIYVRLPRPEILAVDADESSIEEYFIREQGGRIGLLELTDQLDEAKVRIAREAIDRGILDRADENARRLIAGFLAMAGFTEVVFATGEETADEELRG